MLNVLEFMIAEFSAEDLVSSVIMKIQASGICFFPPSITAWQQQTIGAKGARRDPTANVLDHNGTSAGMDAADSPLRSAGMRLEFLQLVRSAIMK